MEKVCGVATSTGLEHEVRIFRSRTFAPATSAVDNMYANYSKYYVSDDTYINNNSTIFHRMGAFSVPDLELDHVFP